MSTAKVFMNQDRPSWSNQPLAQPSTADQKHVLISCMANSNPPALQFLWYRRNGTNGPLLEIHPSPDTDHRLIVAQDYDYDDASGVAMDSNGYFSKSKPSSYMSDQNYQFGHSQQSAVLSVPEFAQLDEYACKVQNHIGISEPCWFREASIVDDENGDQISSQRSSWSVLAEDNLIMVAVTAGFLVFALVLCGSVMIFVCMHRTRSPSFKGFGSASSNLNGGSSQNNTSHRFKSLEHQTMANRAHNLLDSSLDNMDFISSRIDQQRSKTATLTAAYRMHGISGTGSATSGVGTLSNKSYRTLPQNNGGARPFLVSYGSSNVYAEPDEYVHCASNHSGEQLTGSTTVTNASNGNGNIPMIMPTINSSGTNNKRYSKFGR